MVCFHPHASRWVSDDGWVEVCRECSECRDPSPERWPPAHRTVTVKDGRLLFHGPREGYGGRSFTGLYRAVPLS